MQCLHENTRRHVCKEFFRGREFRQEFYECEDCGIRFADEKVFYAGRGNKPAHVKDNGSRGPKGAAK